MDTVQLLEALWRKSLLFITKFQEIPGTSGIPGMK